MLQLFDAHYAPSTTISHQTSIASRRCSAISNWLGRFNGNWCHSGTFISPWQLCSNLHFQMVWAIDPVIIELKWWTLKITFLLSLATAGRRLHLQALSVSTCLFTHGDVQDQLVSCEGSDARSDSPMDTHSRHHSSQPWWARENVVSHETAPAVTPWYWKDSRGWRTRLLIHQDLAIDQRTHVRRWLVEVVNEAYSRAARKLDIDVSGLPGKPFKPFLTFFLR